jgi:hypothetical protein
LGFAGAGGARALEGAEVVVVGPSLRKQKVDVHCWYLVTLGARLLADATLRGALPLLLVELALSGHAIFETPFRAVLGRVLTFLADLAELAPWELGKRRVVGLADVEEDLEDERLASLRHVDDLRTHRGGNTVHLGLTL